MLDPVQLRPNEPDENSIQVQQDRAAIKRWQSRITAALKKWDKDFKRMRNNMEFVFGLQWAGQTTLEDDRYKNNITLRLVNQKVANLYAKNPTATAIPRDKMYYQIWDGNPESLMESVQQAQMMTQAGYPLPLELGALFSDYQQGLARKRLVDKVCQTLEKVYQFQIDSHRPDYKEQLKSVVRRTITCGVAYCRLVYCSQTESYRQVSSVDTKSSMADRMGRIRGLMSKMSEGDVDENSDQFATLRSLMLSLNATQESQDEFTLPERLEFDFPMATDIIPDERCRSLKDFIAARWVAQRFILPVDEVNSIFGTDVKVGAGQGFAMEFSKDIFNPDKTERTADYSNDPLAKQLVCLYCVFDYQTKTHFYMVDGWKDYVEPPAPVSPSVNGFWPIFALTFNDTEVDPRTNASIFPPSDVDIVRSPQREWNRTREALRDQRNANAPKYLTRKGYIDDEDRERLRNATPNSVIELGSVPPEQPLEKFIVSMQMAPIDEKLYDTVPLEQDLLLGAGMQQANIGPAQPNVTATVGTIAEQSRLDVASSNIDDLDGFLSRIAQAGGEMLLQRMPKELVQRIAGIGAVWPDMPQTRQDFLNEVNLTIQAASSGRPNKAISISNFQQIAPMLLQAGANPVAIVKEGVKRLDDNLEIADFFPLLPPGGMAPSGGPPQGQPTGAPGRQVTTNSSQQTGQQEQVPPSSQAPVEGNNL